MAYAEILPGPHPVGLFAPALGAMEKLESLDVPHRLARKQVAEQVVHALLIGSNEFADEAVLLLQPEPFHHAA